MILWPLIEETKDLSKISVKQLMGYLKSHRQNINKHNDEKSEETALIAKFIMKYKNNEMKKNNENEEEKKMEN